jgi:hypothetical protein
MTYSRTSSLREWFVVYLDDILIFTETMEEHDRVTHLVLE